MLETRYPLDLRGVSVAFGEKVVLDNINLPLRAGSVTGLLGRNGSGKSTLLKYALGFLPHGQGTSSIFGEVVASPQARGRLGYVPQTFDAFQHLHVQACLDLVGGFYKTWDRSLVNRFRDAWCMDPTMRVDALSPGQQQLLSILLAIGHRPELLILDEPMAALDPVARRDILKGLIDINVESGTTILLSSHIVSDVERIASHLAILHDAQLLYHGELDQLRVSVRCLYLQGPVLPKQMADVLAYRICPDHAQAWTLDWSQQRIEAFAQDHNLRVHIKPQSLEDAFIGMTT